MRNWDKTGPSSSPKFSFCSSPPHPEHSRGKREHRKGSSSHWGHRLGLSPYLSPLCLHPAAHRPRIQVCKATPPFPEAQPPQPGSVGEKRGRWLNITCTHATPAPAPRANIPAWCPRPGQLHQKAEETGQAAVAGLAWDHSLHSARSPISQERPSRGCAPGALVVEWAGFQHRHSLGLPSLSPVCPAK